jgi:hypothetical protein
MGPGVLQEIGDDLREPFRIPRNQEIVGYVYLHRSGRVNRSTVGGRILNDPRQIDLSLLQGLVEIEASEQ